MKIYKIITVILIFCNGIILAQYTPEMDVRGADDTADGAELQLTTPSETNFLRFFSGRSGDPSPHMYFSNQDTFRIANGGSDFSNFSDRLTILPNGYIGINNSKPQSSLHLEGDLTTPWDVTFQHHQADWLDDNLPYLNKSWNGSLWDYLYLSGSGNRNNSKQGAIILSAQKGILFGKGHNEGNQLDTTYMVLDTIGNLCLNSLAGVGDRLVVANSSGKITTQALSKKIHFNPLVAVVARVGSPLSVGVGAAGYFTASRISSSSNVGEMEDELILFPLQIPEGTIDSITICHSITDAPSDGLEASIYATQLTRMTQTTADFFAEEAGSSGVKDGCYTVPMNVQATGTMNLWLKLTIGTDDYIDIGRITVHWKK